jgi:histidinol-phosphate aminotransferase
LLPDTTIYTRTVANAQARTVDYIEFVAPQHRIDGPNLIRRFPNVIVLRTFSKAYGLAGLRIGYGFASPELVTTLWGMQLSFGLGITSLAAVSASYDAEDQLRQRILHIFRERDHLCRRLRAMGVNTTDGHANFVYLPAIERPWREVFGDTRLEARYYPDGAARITVGSRASTQNGAGHGGKVAR